MSQPRTIRKVLVANRGEIAVRVIRTCREMGLGSVAVYSDADRGGLHVRMADEAVHLGPSPARESYLSIERLLDAAKKTGADAVHPGYGFLSEKAEFARAAEKAGLTFVGPPPEAMEAMGEKTAARHRMKAAGVPVVPGSDGPVADEATAHVEAARLGYPVMIKAAAGGGGKGMKRCDRPEDLAASFASAKREAAAAFADDRLYLEKFLEKPRHVEVQVFCDEHGQALSLGERECSVQRRHQKVIEESPSCIVDEPLRQAMGAVALQAARAVGYLGAGTVEFLVDASRRFYFLEMNTRLQVEHPVTELCTGLDLVRLQLEVARGERLPPPEAVQRRGHAIEARVCAEDPARAFLPSPGKITYLRPPGGPGIRDDSGVYGGFVVPPFYDNLLSKVVAWAPTREQAIARLQRALGDYVIHGIATNVPWLGAVLRHPAFRSGDYHTGFCAAFLPSPGKITYLRPPGGPGIRDDSGVYGGFVVPPFYDNLLSKVVAWAPTREQAIARLQRALGDYVVHGIATNVPWLAAVLGHPAFRSGDYDTGFCAAFARDLVRPPDPSLEEVALIAAAVEAWHRDHDEAEARALRSHPPGAQRPAWVTRPAAAPPPRPAWRPGGAR